MTTPPQRPHGQGTTYVRLQPTAYIDSPDGVRVSYEGSAGLYEVICPDCGDNPDVPYDQLSAELRGVRGPYKNADIATRAVEKHAGIRFR